MGSKCIGAGELNRQGCWGESGMRDIMIVSLLAMKRSGAALPVAAQHEVHV